MNAIVKFFVLLVLLIILFRGLRYISTPLLKKLGFYRYYSRMFLLMPSGSKTYDFHLGTSWDFLQLHRKNPKQILILLAEGLVSVCSDIECGKIRGDAVLKGNIFYLKQSTVGKFGFRSRKLNPLEMILFSLNYLELCILHSISHRRISAVSLQNVMIVYITATELLARKPDFLRVLNRLTGSQIEIIGHEQTKVA